MIKTDKVVYRVRTQEEFFWIIDRLDEAGCKWIDGRFPGDYDEEWVSPKWVSHIWVRNEKISCSNTECFYEYYKDRQDFEIMEVRDLMEEETETQDKTEEETDALEELEAIHKQVTNQIEDLRKQGKEPKAIEYTIKVCFE